MARLILRLLGLGLLAVAIGVPGCQALFQPEPPDASRPMMVDPLPDRSGR